MLSFNCICAHTKSYSSVYSHVKISQAVYVNLASHRGSVNYYAEGCKVCDCDLSDQIEVRDGVIGDVGEVQLSLSLLPFVPIVFMLVHAF